MHTYCSVYGLKLECIDTAVYSMLGFIYNSVYRISKRIYIEGYSITESVRTTVYTDNTLECINTEAYSTSEYITNK
jgi:hypothetical protein